MVCRARVGTGRRHAQHVAPEALLAARPARQQGAAERVGEEAHISGRRDTGPGHAHRPGHDPPRHRQAWGWVVRATPERRPSRLSVPRTWTEPVTHTWFGSADGH